MNLCFFRNRKISSIRLFKDQKRRWIGSSVTGKTYFHGPDLIVDDGSLQVNNCDCPSEIPERNLNKLTNNGPVSSCQAAS